LRRRGLTAVVCAAAIALGAAGCGGSDDGGESGGPASSSPGRKADEQALATLSEQLAEAGRARDAIAYCKHFHPAALRANLGSLKQCAKVFQPLLDEADVPDEYVMQNVEFDGDKALVTYQGEGGTGAYEKIDGKWYVVAPSIENAKPKAQQQ